MKDFYRTIKSEGKSIFKDRGSKFMGFAFHVETLEQIKETLDKLRKDFCDSRHLCYACRLGNVGNLWRVNDDGEPSGSAGKPIYQQIISRDLTNVLVVVIRYSGGVLLGVGGLINAYRTAASDALDKSVIIEKFVEEKVGINFEYQHTSRITKILIDSGAKIIRQEFAEKCIFLISIRQSRLKLLLMALKNLNGIEYKIISNNMH